MKREGEPPTEYCYWCGGELGHKPAEHGMEEYWWHADNTDCPVNVRRVDIMHLACGRKAHERMRARVTALEGLVRDLRDAILARQAGVVTTDEQAVLDRAEERVRK